MSNVSDEYADIIKKYTSIIPVKIVDLARELGLRVFADFNMDDRKSGELRKIGDKYEIHVNGRHSEKRIRFTIAHEIAHYLLHKDVLDARGRFIDTSISPQQALCRDDDCSSGKQLESQANQLAAEILMPEELFKQELNANDNIRDVAKTFNVSNESAAIRSENLGYVVM